MKQNRWIPILCVVLLAGGVALAQPFTRFEFAAGYSYMNYHPNVPQLTNLNLNGGGAALVYNPTSWLGLKAEFMGYSFGSSWSRKLQELGYVGSAAGEMFTYQFGPQIKKHSGRWQPYAATLYGLAHSAGYGAVLRAKGNGTYVLTSGGGNNTAFAMELGGGLDIRLSDLVQLRAVQLDYEMTRFGYKNFSANQNNFKYFAGLNFTFGRR